MIPTQAQTILKAVCVEDIGTTVVVFPQGTYLADGVKLSVSEYNGRQIAVKDVTDIRKITHSRVVSHYVDSKGRSMSKEDFEFSKEVLYSKAKWDDLREEDVWESLEDEFAYRKFIKHWTPVVLDIENVSDPLHVDTTYIRQDTGNPFIVAGFTTGRTDVPLYSYSRTQAVAALMEKKFTSLGMEYKEGASYSQTEDKKIWGNSHHSGLRYVVAFGTYIFNDLTVKKTIGEFKGSLEYLQGLYKEDKQWIEDFIQEKYNLHFRQDVASGVLLSELTSKLQAVRSSVYCLDVKAKSNSSHRQALKKVDEILELVRNEVLG